MNVGEREQLGLSMESTVPLSHKHPTTTGTSHVTFQPATGGTRISDTVEFFPTHCDMPQVNTMETIALILSELKALLQEGHKTHLGKNPTGLRKAVVSLKLLFDKANKQDSAPPPQTSKGDPPRKVTPRTTIQYPDGTIIKRKFNRGWYEGEITKYDPKSKYYTVLYTDGDTEEFTYAEVKEHKKPLQSYSLQPNNTDQLTTRARYYAQLGRLQCKRQHQQQQREQGTDQVIQAAYDKHVRAKHERQHRAYQERQHRAYKAGSQHRAYKAGSIWDADLKKWMSLRDLLQHPGTFRNDDFTTRVSIILNTCYT